MIIENKNMGIWLNGPNSYIFIRGDNIIIPTHGAEWVIEVNEWAPLNKFNEKNVELIFFSPNMTK